MIYTILVSCNPLLNCSDCSAPPELHLQSAGAAAAIVKQSNMAATAAIARHYYKRLRESRHLHGARQQKRTHTVPAADRCSAAAA
jgi:hypothetical protein